MFKKLICGFDEAGRGPLAGPVTAGCVVLPDDFPVEILNDSKKLSEKKRKEAEILIKEKACFGIGIVDHLTIDKINILNASLLAMKKAYEQMILKFPDWCKSQKNCDFKDEINDSNVHDFLSGITDGTFCPSVSCECRAEPKADAKYPEVMAASILAKVLRDEIMIEYDSLYPEYGYKKHKGYPTPFHKNVCREIGPSPIQRMTFKY